MSSSDLLYDVEGNLIPLATMCRTQPAWTANKIHELQQELTEAEKRVAEVEKTKELRLKDCVTLQAAFAILRRRDGCVALFPEEWSAVEAADKLRGVYE